MVFKRIVSLLFVLVPWVLHADIPFSKGVLTHEALDNFLWMLFKNEFSRGLELSKSRELPSGDIEVSGKNGQIRRLIKLQSLVNSARNARLSGIRISDESGKIILGIEVRTRGSAFEPWPAEKLRKGEFPSNFSSPNDLFIETKITFCSQLIFRYAARRTIKDGISYTRVDYLTKAGEKFLHYEDDSGKTFREIRFSGLTPETREPFDLRVKKNLPEDFIEGTEEFFSMSTPTKNKAAFRNEFDAKVMATFQGAQTGMAVIAGFSLKMPDINLCSDRNSF